MASRTGERHRPPALIAILIVPAVVAIALFTWPAANLEPRDLPFGLAGPAQAIAPFHERLEAREGAFDVRRYDARRPPERQSRTVRSTARSWLGPTGRPY
jgi:hypothetical protein